MKHAVIKCGHRILLQYTPGGVIYAVSQHNGYYNDYDGDAINDDRIIMEHGDDDGDRVADDNNGSELMARGVLMAMDD